MKFELYHVALNSGRDKYYIRWESPKGVIYSSPEYKETFISDIDWLIRNADDHTWCYGVFNLFGIISVIAASDDFLDLKLQVPWLFL